MPSLESKARKRTKPLSTFPRTVENITGPAGETARIRQLNKTVFAMSSPVEPNRSRFGTKAEIAKDADFFKRTGRLPAPNPNRVF